MKLPGLRSLYRQYAPHRVKVRVAALRQRLRHLQARQDPRYIQSRERLSELRDAHRGEACVIIGNGPSMRGFDLSALAGIKTFSLNRGHLMWKAQGRVPDYMVAVNQLVTEQFGAELQAVGSTLFVPWLHRRHFDCSVGNVVFFEERWDDAFMRDARNGISSLATVTNSALQLAWHMGFSNVILIGIDHHFAAAASGQPHEMVVQAGNDVDHFHPEYFAPGVRWHLPDLAQSERGYRLARAVFEADGRRIVNATPGTRLEVFDRADLSDIVRQLRSDG